MHINTFEDLFNDSKERIATMPNVLSGKSSLGSTFNLADGKIVPYSVTVDELNVIKIVLFEPQSFQQALEKDNLRLNNLK